MRNDFIKIVLWFIAEYILLNNLKTLFRHYGMLDEATTSRLMNLKIMVSKRKPFLTLSGNMYYLSNVLKMVIKCTQLLLELWRQFSLPDRYLLLTSKRMLRFSKEAYTEKQLLFLCQPEVGNYLIGHPVCKATTWSQCCYQSPRGRMGELEWSPLYLRDILASSLSSPWMKGPFVNRAMRKQKRIWRNSANPEDLSSPSRIVSAVSIPLLEELF